MVTMDESDIVRHSLVQRIVEAYGATKQTRVLEIDRELTPENPEVANPGAGSTTDGVTNPPVPPAPPAPLSD